MEVSPTNLRHSQKNPKKLNALTTIVAASAQMITENELASHLPCIVFATNEPDDVTEMPEWNSTNNIPRNVAFLVERKSLHGSFREHFSYRGENYTARDYLARAMGYDHEKFLHCFCEDGRLLQLREIFQSKGTVALPTKCALVLPEFSAPRLDSLKRRSKVPVRPDMVDSWEVRSVPEDDARKLRVDKPKKKLKVDKPKKKETVPASTEPLKRQKKTVVENVTSIVPVAKKRMPELKDLFALTDAWDKTPPDFGNNKELPNLFADFMKVVDRMKHQAKLSEAEAKQQAWNLELEKLKEFYKAHEEEIAAQRAKALAKVRSEIEALACGTYTDGSQITDEELLSDFNEITLTGPHLRCFERWQIKRRAERMNIYIGEGHFCYENKLISELLPPHLITATLLKIKDAFVASAHLWPREDPLVQPGYTGKDTLIIWESMFKKTRADGGPATMGFNAPASLLMFNSAPVSSPDRYYLI